MCAPAAARSCARSKAIVACSAPMGRRRVRPFRRNAKVRPVLPLVARGDRHGERDDASFPRLVAYSGHSPLGMVDSASCGTDRPIRAYPGSNRCLDRRTDLDGRRLHSQCKAVRAHPLPLHGTLLSRHDRSSACARLGLGSCRFLRLAYPGRSHSRWKQAHLVGKRAGVGEILLNRRPDLYLAGPPAAYHAPGRI